MYNERFQTNLYSIKGFLLPALVLSWFLYLKKFFVGLIDGNIFVLDFLPLFAL